MPKILNILERDITFIGLIMYVKNIKQQKHEHLIENQSKTQKKQKEYCSEKIDFVRKMIKNCYEKNLPSVR